MEPACPTVDTCSVVGRHAAQFRTGARRSRRHRDTTNDGGREAAPLVNPIFSDKDFLLFCIDTIIFHFILLTLRYFYHSFFSLLMKEI